MGSPCSLVCGGALLLLMLMALMTALKERLCFIFCCLC